MKTRNWNSKSLAVGGGLTLALLMNTTALVHAASAQDTQAADPAIPESKGAQPGTKPSLEVIIVTADRKNTYGASLVQAGSFRGATQLDTPLTVNVLPQEVITSQQALMIGDVMKNTPGVTSSQTSPVIYSNLAIRGIAVENRGNFRLNGSLPILGLIDLPLEDKDRVEALKGASALYYGFTAPSGIINLTMKRPTPDPMLATTVFGDSNSSLGLHVDAGGTAGNFGARVNAVYANVDYGIRYAEGNRALLSGAFDWKPTDKLTFNLDMEYIFKKANEPYVFNLLNPKSTTTNLYPVMPIPDLPDAKQNLGPSWSWNRTREANVLFRSHYKISDAWDFTLEAGTSQLTRDRHFNQFTPNYADANNYAFKGDGSGVVRVNLQPGQTYHNRNIRTELAGTFYTGPFLHELLVGWSENVRDLYASTATAFSYNQNMFNPVAAPAEPALGVRVGAHTRIDDVGAYLFDRVKYGSWLQVLVGVRKVDYTESNLDTGVTTFHATPTPVSYGVVIKPKSWISIYSTYIEGLETTAAAPITAVNALDPQPPTQSKQKELGLKIEPKKGLLLAVSSFDIDRGLAYLNGANRYVVDGRGRYKGTELNLTGDISRNLSVYASATFLDAKQEQGADTVISGTNVTPTQNGLRIENTAKTTWSVSGQYRLNSLLDGLSVTAGVYYIGDRAVNPLNEAFVPGFTTYDLGMSYKTKIYNKSVTFRVNGVNVTNEKYWVSTGGNLMAVGAPGSVKFSMTTRY